MVHRGELTDQQWEKSGSDLRVVQGMLGHSSIVVTSDIYTSVLPEVYHQSAQAIARLVLVGARKTARKVRKRGRDRMTQL